MIHLLFYISVFHYYIKYFFMTNNFDILGPEFVAMITTGLLANLNNKQGVRV